VRYESVLAPRFRDFGEGVLEARGQGKVLPVLDVWNEVGDRPLCHVVKSRERVRCWGITDVILVQFVILVCKKTSGDIDEGKHHCTETPESLDEEFVHDGPYEPRLPRGEFLTTNQ